MTGLGVIFRPELAPERLIDIARIADDTGIEQLWLWEDCFYAGGLTSAATALAVTSRIEVGVGVLPVPMRNVAIAAMEVAGLSRLHPDRFRPGFGHGVLDWMGQIGARAQSPMTLLREYLVALRALLAGQTVHTDGRYVSLDGVSLAWPPEQPPAISVAATGPRTIALSAELGDVTLFTAESTFTQLRAAREILDRTRAEHGRAGRQELTVYLTAMTGPGAAARLEAENRRWEVSADDSTGVAGDAEAVAEGIARAAAAGADTVVLQPASDDPDIEGFVRFVGEQVRPLVAGH
jgi:alkanesulfonate monooxygenase SsuD/methylene tetrahydromethanopterin reductase-like flavin-dependent oxidoreductase (luciferase family)